MQNGDAGAGRLPFVHWPSIIHPAPQAYLALPLPAPPTATYKLAAENQQQDALADADTLSSLICALQSVDVAHLRPLRAAHPGAGDPRSALQRQVAEAAPGIFSGTQVPAPTTATLPTKPHRAAKKAAAAAPDAIAQAAQQQQQQQVVSPRADALPARVADKPPAAKRARVVRVAVSANRGQEEMPAEEASKAAAAYTACITEFVARHGQAAAELGKRQQANGTPGGHESDAEEGSEGEEEEGEKGGAGVGASSAGLALLRAVRRLCVETLRMCRADHVAALRAVPPDPLLRLLHTLHRLVKGGQGRLLEPGDSERTPRAQAILVALEAAAAALHLLTVPGLPARAYNEDLMEAVLDLVRFQLTYNVYPFHDARLRSAARPKLAAAAAAAADAAAGTGRKQSAKRAREAAAAGIGMPPAMAPLLDRCQALLLLAADLLRGVRLPAAAALPLLRAAAVGLAVEGQALLQEKAVRLLVAAFRVFPEQRISLLDELFGHVVPHLGGGPRAPRDFPASEDARTCIQMLAAAVLQMIQGCVDIPAVDCPPERLADCYKGAATCADYFWTLCFDRLPGSRGAKADSDADVRPLLGALLRDLLACAHLPAWPAAPFLLLRLAALLQGERGLRHADPHVRQHSLDLLASLAAQLHADEVAVAADAPLLQQLAKEHGGSADVAEEAPGLLLAYLSDPRRAGHEAAASARAFLLCQAFAEEVTHLHKAGAGPEQLTEKLVQYRRQREELEAQGAEVGLDAEQAQRLARYVVQGSLGRARASMVQWLLDCLAPGGQAPTTRCKAVKALGEVAAADPRVLDTPWVQAAVERALQDEAVSVREAAVSLLGRHAAGNQALALRLFSTLARAATDPGTSVRKSAIKILWECCISAPGFPRATDACKHVLMRAADPEESIQDMVARVFHSLWFTPRLEAEEGGAPVARSAAQRAQQLADVAAAVYEAGGRAIHLPLEQSHPLVAVLRSALGAGARGDLKKEVAAGREVAAALLDLFLTAQETSQAGEQAGFAHLLALHAFAVTDVELCMPPGDPGKFVRSLAPYLKVAPEGGEGGEAARRRGAESLLCVLSVLSGVLGQLERCEAATLAQLLPDLLHLVNRHPFVQVLAAAAACLTTLAAREPAAATQLASCAAFYAGRLREAATARNESPTQQQQPALLCRFLFILGQLCRRGADALEATPPEGGGQPLAMAECQRIFVAFCGAGQRDLKVAEAALGAIGALTIARPAVMVDKRSPANRILKAALQRSAPEPLKLRALTSLIELLRADEDDMLAAQADGGEALGGPAPQPAVGPSGKRRGRKAAAAAAEAAAAAAAAVEGRGLATQNGEGDTLSQSSSILQDNWAAVLELATDTTPAGPGAAAATSPPGSAGGADLAPGTHVRRRAVELMEIVLRGGLVGPWTAVAPLMALAADPLEEVRGRALRLLRALCDKHPRYLDADRLCGGVVEAYRFRAALAQASRDGHRGWEGGAPPQALAGLSAVYAHLIQPRFQLRCDFLRGLLKRLRLGACLVSGGAAEADPRLLAFCAAVAAGLPYRRGDEPCLVVQEINGIVSRSGESVKEELKRSLCGAAAPGGGPASPGPASVQLMAQCKASLALSLLLLLKEYLKAAYSVNGERIVAFAAAGERRRVEEKVAVAALPGVPTHLDKLDLGAHRDPQRLRAQYKLFKQLMKRDAADYGHLVADGRGKRGGSEEPEAPGSGGGGGDLASPGGGPGEDDTPGWLEGLGRAPGGAGTGRGRGGRGGRGGRSAGRGRGSAAGGRGRKKRKVAASSDEEEEDSGGSGDDYEPRPRAASTRKRLPMTR